jgi:hypothetical protein
MFHAKLGRAGQRRNSARNRMKRAGRSGLLRTRRLRLDGARRRPGSADARILEPTRDVVWAAATGCSASQIGGCAFAVCGALLGVLGCGGAAAPLAGASPRGLHVVTAPAPSAQERFCAWYGEPQDGVLYFGESAFWSELRSHGGDPKADLRLPGPRRIGRFDLAREALLSAIELGTGADATGVWDVLPTREGWLYFTTFFELAGRTTLTGEHSEDLPRLGQALNELATGPGGTLLATRYGSGGDGPGDGSVIAFDASGALVAEWSLAGLDAALVAPKTAAWDAARGELWITADLLPRAAAGELRRAAFVLDRRGELLRRIDTPEIQFVRAGRDGALLRAEVEAGVLRLVITPAPGAARAPDIILLDAHFPTDFDFVQDLQLADDGRIVATRWSGWVHVVDRKLHVSSVALPRLDPDGLYYTAVARGQRICATYCADVTVVCVDAPH